jgi:hypothetical protein
MELPFILLLFSFKIRRASFILFMIKFPSPLSNELKLVIVPYGVSMSLSTNVAILSSFIPIIISNCYEI